MPSILIEATGDKQSAENGEGVGLSGVSGRSPDQVGLVNDSELRSAIVSRPPTLLVRTADPEFPLAARAHPLPVSGLVEVARRHSPKTCVIGIRMSTEDAEALRAEAMRCGLPLSEYLRQCIAGASVASREDEKTALSIERAARMLKHLHSADRPGDTEEDRAQRASLMRELEHTAKVLRRTEA